MLKIHFWFWGQDVGSDCISSWSLLIFLLWLKQLMNRISHISIRAGSLDCGTSWTIRCMLFYRRKCIKQSLYLDVSCMILVFWPNTWLGPRRWNRIWHQSVPVFNNSVKELEKYILFRFLNWMPWFAVRTFLWKWLSIHFHYLYGEIF